MFPFDDIIMWSGDLKQTYWYCCLSLFCLCAGPGFYIAIGGAVGQYASSHIMDILQDKKFDCQLLDHSEDMCLLSVQGPNRYGRMSMKR